jgi:hypothetical protein
MTPLVLKLLNLVAFVVNIAFNKIGNAKQDKKGGAIKVIADAYDHVALPKGAAFAIWGIIYAWELIFVVAQFFVPEFDGRLEIIAPWFVCGQLLQGTWVLIFTKTDPEGVGKGGDACFWVSTVLLLATPCAFLQTVASCSSLTGVAYWLALGITVNAAWVLLAAGLAINQAARAIGLEGTALSATAMVVLISTIGLLFWITGLVGNNPFHTPRAFFPVATWALFFIFQNLKDAAAGESDHAKRILPLYGSSFIEIYKWTCIALAVAFIGLEIVVCVK